MNGIVSIVLDLVLIGLLAAGIHYAMRLSQQIAGLRASKAEMERFVVDFSSTVQRAEAGIHGLKHAARSSGDDLEQLIDKAQSLRDELQFLVDSADQIASRLSSTAASATRIATPDLGAPSAPPPPRIQPKPVAVAPQRKDPAPVVERQAPLSPSAASAAERELLKVLGKLG